MKQAYRTEHDSLGEVHVPSAALYGAQTQRAVTNFQFSTLHFPASMIAALAHIKAAAAQTNKHCKTISAERADAMSDAATELFQGKLDHEIVVDIFQTGSGTSLNMNVNEVIAQRAQEMHPKLNPPLHPNDDVNRSQSSNDVIPSALRIAALLQIHAEIFPACEAVDTALITAIARDAEQVKLGRTHLMDAMPVSWTQVWESWRDRLTQDRVAIVHAATALAQLPLGGTAVGNGVNTPAEFSSQCIATLNTTLSEVLSEPLSLPLSAVPLPMSRQAGSEAILTCSAAMRQLASTVLRLADDLRWMASGPQAGLGELNLPRLQPGSSIMPGKNNPVIEEAVIQACLQVNAHDYAIAQACLFGSFELHTMQPLMTHNLLEGLRLLAQAMQHLAHASIAKLQINTQRSETNLKDHPILITAIAPIIGYEKAAQIAKLVATAQDAGQPQALRALIKKHTDLSLDQIDRLLDPKHLATPQQQ